jgi:thioester reductase-like protein
VQESDRPDDPSALFGGYAQSKWVAERLAAEAARRGLPLTIYRPGLVTGHSRTGAGSRDDMLALLVKGCIQLGAIPEIDTQVDMTPVDYASRALVYLSLRAGAAREVYHLSNPHPAAWTEVAGWIRDYGYLLEPLPYEGWRAGLEGPDGPRLDNALFPLMPLLSERGPTGQPLLAEARMPGYNCERTLAALEGSGLACPALDRELVRTYLDHFVRIGFIPEPETARQGTAS